MAMRSELNVYLAEQHQQLALRCRLDIAGLLIARVCLSSIAPFWCRRTLDQAGLGQRGSAVGAGLRAGEGFEYTIPAGNMAEVRHRARRRLQKFADGQGSTAHAR